MCFHPESLSYQLKNSQDSSNLSLWNQWKIRENNASIRKVERMCICQGQFTLEKIKL
jgi:hypothetical protein